MTDLPVRSMTTAPAGTLAPDAGPTDAMRPSRMITVWSARAGAPVPSITRTCVSATVGVSTCTNWRTGLASVGRWADDTEPSTATATRLKDVDRMATRISRWAPRVEGHLPNIFAAKPEDYKAATLAFYHTQRMTSRIDVHVLPPGN